MDIASIKGFSDVSAIPPSVFEECFAQGLALRCEDDCSIIAAPTWDDLNWFDRSFLMAAGLAIFAHTLPGSEMKWLFSGETVEWDDSQHLLDEWMEEGIPPVDALVKFVFEDVADQRRVSTVGLIPIVGHELDLLFHRQPTRESMAIIVHLAQNALRRGPIAMRRVIDPHGKIYSLVPQKNDKTGQKVVRITSIAS
jgi:hypothetical protein